MKKSNNNTKCFKCNNSPAIKKAYYDFKEVFVCKECAEKYKHEHTIAETIARTK